MSLVASFDPDAEGPVQRPASPRHAAVYEAGFQMYWRFLGVDRIDEGPARSRFARLRPRVKERWFGDAEVCFRQFERMRTA